MKQNTGSPQIDKNNGNLSGSDNSVTNKIHQHLQDKNHKISDEDIRSFPVESVSAEDNIEEVKEIESGSNVIDTKITEEDPDGENKNGLESPWNIFS